MQPRKATSNVQSPKSNKFSLIQLPYWKGNFQVMEKISHLVCRVCIFRYRLSKGISFQSMNLQTSSYSQLYQIQDIFRLLIKKVCVCLFLKVNTNYNACKDVEHIEKLGGECLRVYSINLTTAAESSAFCRLVLIVTLTSFFLPMDITHPHVCTLDLKYLYNFFSLQSNA